jgi:hypothetical protein
MKKYLISLGGWGVETVFIQLKPESYSWWFQNSQDEDFDITEYITDPEEFKHEVPKEFDFLLVDDDSEYQSWDDNDWIFCQASTPDLDTCHIIVEELGEDGYYNKEVYNDNLSDISECILHVGSLIDYEDVPEQVMEINSSEKGIIFGAEIETEDFDISKLSIVVKEGPNGHDYIDGVFYDREELINTESSTRGKGIEVIIWEK